MAGSMVAIPILLYIVQYSAINYDLWKKAIMHKFKVIFVSLSSALLGKKDFFFNYGPHFCRNASIYNKRKNGKAEFTLWNLMTLEHFHEDSPAVTQAGSAHTIYNF